MPSPAEVSNFQRIVTNLAAIAVSRVSGLLTSTQDSALLQEAYPQTIDPFIAAAGQLSAEWYGSLAPESDYAVEPGPTLPISVLQKNVRWAVTQADVFGALTGSAERQVFTATRNTVLYNAERERVRFARYASANACPWCRVLATREAVYYTQDSAVAGHDNCHCIAVPVRGSNSYTPPDYVQQWTKEYQDARDEVGGNLNDIVNHLRRTAP
jgi:hypothetical protein